MEGKNFLITGAANGIGLEFARMGLSFGGRVVITDVDVVNGKSSEADLQKHYGEDRVKFLELDVRSEESWTRAWDEAEEWLGDKVMSISSWLVKYSDDHR